MFKPLSDYVVVKKQEAGDQVVNGVLLPGDLSEDAPVGIVVAVGPGFRDSRKFCNTGHLMPMDVKKGDQVLFYEQAAVKFKHEGEEYYAMKQSNIFLIFDAEAADDESSEG